MPFSGSLNSVPPRAPMLLDVVTVNLLGPLTADSGTT